MKGDKNYKPLTTRVNQNRLPSGRVEQAGTSSAQVPSLLKKSKKNEQRRKQTVEKGNSGSDENVDDDHDDDDHDEDEEENVLPDSDAVEEDNPPSTGRWVNFYLFLFLFTFFQPVNGKDWLQKVKGRDGKIKYVLRRRNTRKCIGCNKVRDWPKRPGHAPLEEGQICKDCKNTVTTLQADGLIGVYCPKTRNVR